MTEFAEDSGDTDAVAAFAVGHEIVAGYRAWQVLGSGPRCETWLAWSDARRIPVALKIPRFDMYDHPSPRVALTREVEALRRVAHPSLPRLLDADLVGALPYMATEYVEGPTLSEVLHEDGPFGAPEVALLGAQIAIAVGHLHDLGLVHHDVKPHNVMLHNGRVTLIDLGFVQRAGVAPLPGGPRGTDAYMAPEQRKCVDNTAASDVYALGLLLLEALTGVVDPDTTEAGDWVEPRLAQARQRDDLGSVTLLRSIEHMIADDPLMRPLGCDAVIAALRPSLPGNDVPWPSFVEPRFVADPIRLTSDADEVSSAPIPWVATWTSEAESERWSRPFGDLLAAMGTARDDRELIDEADALWPAGRRQVWELGGLHGVGEPIFNRLHPGRQRRAMLEGRCSVCATVVAPPWTFVGHLSEKGRTPAFREPPLCARCLPRALSACPGLRAYIGAGTLSIVIVEGYMPVPEFATTDDPDDPDAPVEYLIAIPVEHGWRTNEDHPAVSVAPVGVVGDTCA